MKLSEKFMKIKISFGKKLRMRGRVVYVCVQMKRVEFLLVVRKLNELEESF